MNKNTFRYYPSFIFAFIVIVSILLTIVSLNLITINFYEQSGDHYNEVYLNTLEVVRKSRYDRGYSQKFNGDFIDYVISRNEKQILQYKKEDEEAIKALTDKTFIHISTNIREVQLDDKSFLPSKDIDTSTLSDKTLWITGTFAKGKLIYQTNLEDFDGVDYKIGKTFINPIINEYEYMKNDYYDFKDSGTSLNSDETEKNKIVSHDFYYAIDLENPNLLKLISYRKQASNFLVKAILTPIIASIIMMLLVVFTNYAKSRKYRTFDGLINIPMELYILFLVLLLSIVSINAHFLKEEIFKLFIEYPVLQYLTLFLLCVITMIYAGYFVMVTKSLYYDGMKSFLIEKSIAIKLCRFILKNIRKGMKRFIQFFVGISLVKKIVLVGVYLVGLLCIFAIVNILNGSMLVFLLLSLVFTYFMYKLKTYFDHINEIEKATEEISIGNYKVKVDEENNIFKKLAKNINQMTKSLRLAVDKELKSERLKTELITNVSHDLKTPLTSIINYSELINEENTSNEDRKEYAKVINEKSKKLKVLIDNLFELSKATSNNVKLNIQNIDFKELVNQICGEWTDKFNEKKLNVILKVPERDVYVNLDGQQTSRILDNVFSNIYKYALEGTRVYIDLLSEETTTLEVKNISKYPLNISSDDLMERFIRGDESRNTEGSGLGLSIAKQLTDIQNGTFDINILGDVFVITLEFK